jgi:hypothetical protein
MDDSTRGLYEALEARPRTVPDVIATMEAIGQRLDAADGIACFNRLYLETTRQVGAALDASRFADPAFMERLDVVFAGLYFEALRSEVTARGTGPRAWDALFEARARRPMHPLRFALAGMNAHINYALARALVRTAAALGGELASGSPRHHDFLAINAVLADTEAGVKRRFVEGALAVVDDAMGQLDDRTAIWSIARARDAAWTQGLVLWTLRGTALEGAYAATLDRSVGLVGRALLV